MQRCHGLVFQDSGLGFYAFSRKFSAMERAIEAAGVLEGEQTPRYLMQLEVSQAHKSHDKWPDVFVVLTHMKETDWGKYGTGAC
eukprot:3277548-Amphidinium_carterae.1